MPHADFVHLRVHSAYSLSEGALKIPEIVALCKAAQMPAVAIADTNNLFGALEFSAACKEGGIQPIIGCQLALAGERPERTGVNRDYDQIVLLAQNATGYGNLMKLSSAAYLGPGPGEVAHIGWAVLEHRTVELGTELEVGRVARREHHQPGHPTVTSSVCQAGCSVQRSFGSSAPASRSAAIRFSRWCRSPIRSSITSP